MRRKEGIEVEVLVEILGVEFGVTLRGGAVRKQRESEVQVLLENKREMFDGMRAYHESEIRHATHAVTMLLGIATAAGWAVTGILGGRWPEAQTAPLAWTTFVAVTVFALVVAITSHVKINNDHRMYAEFGREYVRVSERLGLFEADSRGGAVKRDTNIGEGAGYRKTQAVIWAFAMALIGLTSVFLIVALCLLV